MNLYSSYKNLKEIFEEYRKQFLMHFAKRKIYGDTKIVNNHAECIIYNDKDDGNTEKVVENNRGSVVIGASNTIDDITPTYCAMIGIGNNIHTTDNSPSNFFIYGERNNISGGHKNPTIIGDHNKLYSDKYSITNNDHQYIFGYYNEIIGNNCIPLRESIISGCYNNVNTQVRTDYGILHGHSNEISNVFSYSSILGCSNNIGKFMDSSLIGYNNSISSSGSNNSDFNSVLGAKNQLSNISYANIIGEENIVENSSQLFLLGNKCEINTYSNESCVIGHGSTLKNSRITYSFGYKNEINTTTNCNLIGYYNSISNSGYSTIVGANNSVSNIHYTTLVGSNLKSNYNNQFIIGEYNDNSDDNLFEFGAGTYTNRKNVLYIDRAEKKLHGKSFVDENGTDYTKELQFLRETMISTYTELKQLILSQDPTGAVAVLDKAILDLSKLK